MTEPAFVEPTEGNDGEVQPAELAEAEAGAPEVAEEAADERQY